ncbi:hypothetical protein [Myroides profundi]|uniref:Uncharacterized protein n=1 Tax=Myroides profundi TaxID=480520 RepID=A0AAJ4W264_MYRPR|nr:hypothetical protein [Myroides profundi]SEQ42284.1 hypothetical protein SAMN04488089_103100 [Myroides profundi]
MKRKIVILINTLMLLIVLGCKDTDKRKEVAVETNMVEEKEETVEEEYIGNNDEDSFVLSPDHEVNSIKVDFDGDGKEELFEIFKGGGYENYAIIITWGNGEKHIIGSIDGATHYELIPQWEILWMQRISVVEKGTVLFDYIDGEGNYRNEEDVPESEKVILKNEGLSIGVGDSCGSGILYWEEGEYKWFQTS